MVVVTGEWKCERETHARVKKEWKITLKVLKMSGKLMAVGCWFPLKFPNSGTLTHPLGRSFTVDDIPCLH